MSPVTLYTSTAPKLTGGYQRLVIRESNILRVRPETMDLIGETAIKYYEVCTNQEIFEFVKNKIQTGTSLFTGRDFRKPVGECSEKLHAGG